MISQFCLMTIVDPVAGNLWVKTHSRKDHLEITGLLESVAYEEFVMRYCQSTVGNILPMEDIWENGMGQLGLTTNLLYQ